MQNLIAAFNDLITDHWVKFVTAAAFTAIGWLVARWRADREWKKREFFNRLNISLNSISDGTLRIRTISEKLCSDIFLNRVAVDRLISSAQQTEKDQPIIPVARADSWFYLNSVLNELSEQFAEGLLRREAGLPHKAVRYLICLTNECDGEIRTRKIRAMVIQKELLLALPDEQPKLESPNHSIRWKTLKHMQARYAQQPWQFLEAEVVV